MSSVLLFIFFGKFDSYKYIFKEGSILYYKMNTEQKKAFDSIVDGNNILLTGGAGVGKSYVLKHVISWAKANNIKIGVTASTGSAAILIRGTTVHSYLGIGIGNKSAEKLASEVKVKRKFIYKRLIGLDILIIDEISMLSDKIIELISDFLKIIRGDDRPFGGLQLVLCGDMFQLSPVDGGLFFKSKVWDSLVKDGVKVVELKESHRHKDDLQFIKMLNELRWGKCSKKIIDMLKQTEKNIFDKDIRPTLLFSKNLDVDKINKEKFDELVDKTGAKVEVFPLKVSGESAKMWAGSCKVPEVCEVAVGAQVVLTWNVNLDHGLCNGARGVVEEVSALGVHVRFTSGITEIIEYTEVENEETPGVWMKFMPLRLAYALTINKSQGMTLDCAIIVLDENGYTNSFGFGRAYTALSRVRNLKCVRVHNVSSKCFIASPDVVEFYKKYTV
jgi:ATP-dependent DNA helicase PIF1